MIRIKKLHIFVICNLLIVGGVLLIVLNTTKEKSDTNDSSTDTSVTISGLEAGVIPPNSTINKENVELAIKGAVIKNGADNGKPYSAVYRENSLSKITTTTNIPKVRYLVDIPELERTFAVEVEGGPGYDYETVYALCPKPNELKYEQKACDDTP